MVHCFVSLGETLKDSMLNHIMGSGASLYEVGSKYNLFREYKHIQRHTEKLLSKRILLRMIVGFSVTDLNAGTDGGLTQEFITVYEIQRLILSLQKCLSCSFCRPLLLVSVEGEAYSDSVCPTGTAGSF